MVTKDRRLEWGFDQFRSRDALIVSSSHTQNDKVAFMAAEPRYQARASNPRDKLIAGIYYLDWSKQVTSFLGKHSGWWTVRKAPRPAHSLSAQSVTSKP